MNISDLYAETGLQARPKTAGELCGPCPDCGGTDRFTLFTGQGKDGQGRFWCRQCGKSGDRIQFLREFRGVGYKDACHILGLDPGRPRDHGPAPGPKPPAAASAPLAWEPRENALPGPRWQARARALVEWAAARLAREEAALAWLDKERGLGPETVKAARLGWIPEDMYRPRAAWGLPEERKPDGSPKRLWIPRGLSIPVFDASGGIKRIKFRRPQGEPKYIPLPTEPKNTAPLLIPTGAKAWAVVGSELDAFLLAQEAAGLVNVLALGSASYPPDAEALPLLRAAPFVLLCLDYDAPGQKRVYQWWARQFPAFKPWPVPEGKDVSDAWALGWDLAAWITGGLPPALSRTGKAGPAGQEKAAQAPTPESQPGPCAQPGPEGEAQIPATGEAGQESGRDREPEPRPRARDDHPTRKPGGRLAGVLDRYKRGRAWIEANRSEMEAQGWTARTLFRAGRYAYPYGEWGLAWAGPWDHPGLSKVHLPRRQVVEFVIAEGGREVAQRIEGQ